MIAELPDGSELRFPDEMSDAQVGAVVRRILAAEKAAALAKHETELLRAKVDALLAQPKTAPPGAAPAAMDHKPIVVALETLRTEINAGLARMLTAQLADTVLVRDATGEAIGSKKVKKG